MSYPVSVAAKGVAHRVAIIEDHAAIVGMMAPLIDSMNGFKVIGHATEPEEGIELCRRLSPDVAIVDWVMPRITGLELVRQLKRASPRTHVLVFSGNLWPAAIRGALAAGVLGMVDKMASIDVFRMALRSVADGRAYFSPLVSDLIKQLVSRGASASAPPVTLSPREKSVLRLIAEGYSSKEIAERLGLSTRTVFNHRAKMMHKIGLRRAAQLSLYAAQIGLLGSGLTPGGDSPSGPAP